MTRALNDTKSNVFSSPFSRTSRMVAGVLTIHDIRSTASDKDNSVVQPHSQKMAAELLTILKEALDDFDDDPYSPCA